MPEGETIRIALIDHFELVRSSLAYQINSEPDLKVVASVANVNTAIAAVGKIAPHVVLIEADLDGEDLFSAVRRLRNAWTDTKVILLFTQLRDAVLMRALTLSVDGIVTKQDSFLSISNAIHTAAGGLQSFSRFVSDRLASVAERACAKTPDKSRLSSREHEVLFHLATGRTVRQIAKILGLSQNTVDNHKTRLMKKINVHSQVALARYAIREGLVSL